jgi:hypothetical protein
VVECIQNFRLREFGLVRIRTCEKEENSGRIDCGSQYFGKVFPAAYPFFIDKTANPHFGERRAYQIGRLGILAGVTDKNVIFHLALASCYQLAKLVYIIGIVV